MGGLSSALQEASFLNKHIVSKLIHTLIVYSWGERLGRVTGTACHWPPPINPPWQGHSALRKRKKEKESRVGESIDPISLPRRHSKDIFHMKWTIQFTESAFQGEVEIFSSCDTSLGNIMRRTHGPQLNSSYIFYSSRVLEMGSKKTLPCQYFMDLSSYQLFKTLLSYKSF